MNASKIQKNSDFFIKMNAASSLLGIEGSCHAATFFSSEYSSQELLLDISFTHQLVSGVTHPHEVSFALLTHSCVIVPH